MKESSSAAKSPGRAAVGRVVRAAFLLAAVAAPPAGAQDFDDMAAPAPLAPDQENFLLSPRNFEAWIYGNIRPSASGEDRFESLLTLSVEDVERACRLTDAQRKKLLLAGRGDIKRFQDRVEAARRVFVRYQNDRTMMGVIHQETVPLAAAYRAGLLGEGSFFAKTLRTILDPEQVTRYQASIAERDRFRHRAKVVQAVANLDSAVGLTADQRRRLIELTLEGTSPATKPGGPYEMQIVLLNMSRMPPDKLRAIFDDAQWATVNRSFQQVRAMEQFFRASGYLDDPPAGAVPPRIQAR